MWGVLIFDNNIENQLYHIISLENLGSLIKAEIKIMDTHPIFDGHFPDVPVLPGATMMQIAKELLEERRSEVTKYLVQP